MATITKSAYRVEMSTDGNHKVIVTIDDPAGTDAALAWAQGAYYKLTHDVQNTPGGNQTYVQGSTPECLLHRQPMTKVQGKLGPFWSCHQKNNDGSWCNYRPSQN